MHHCGAYTFIFRARIWGIHGAGLCRSILLRTGIQLSEALLAGLGSSKIAPLFGFVYFLGVFASGMRYMLYELYIVAGKLLRQWRRRHAI